MVKYSGAALDATFSALSDPTRRAILARLALGETSISEIAAPYNISLPAVSKHLRVLKNAGLIARQKNGRVNRCRLLAGPMKDAADWIEQYRLFWEDQLKSLARFMESTQVPTQAEPTQRTDQNMAFRSASKSGGHLQHGESVSGSHKPKAQKDPNRRKSRTHSTPNVQ